jgi:hypothetical protein
MSFRAVWNETTCGTRSLHSLQRMDPKNLISRIELAAAFHVHPQTIAAWTRRGLFPEPKECLSDRVILYDRDEVRRARTRLAPGYIEVGKSILQSLLRWSLSLLPEKQDLQE